MGFVCSCTFMLKCLIMGLIENKLISKGSFGIERYFPLHTVSTESPKTKISAAESGGNGCKPPPGDDRNFQIRDIHSVRLVGLSQFYMESLNVRPSDVNKDGRNIEAKKIPRISALPSCTCGSTVRAVESQSRCFGSTLMSSIFIYSQWFRLHE